MEKKTTIIIKVDFSDLDKLEDLMEKYRIKTRSGMIRYLINHNFDTLFPLIKELTSVVGKMNHEIREDNN